MDTSIYYFVTGISEISKSLNTNLFSYITIEF